jgi:hypothetical protein
MKKHQTLYITGAVLLLLGGYMYMKKTSANKINLAPPMEADNVSTTETPTPTSTTGGTLTGASQVLDSIKGLIAEIKNKSTKAVKTITPIV